MSREMLNRVIALGSLFWISMSIGFIFGHISNMVSALQKNEEKLNFTENEISLIASMFTMVCIIGFGLVAVVTDSIGAKRSFMIFSLPVVLNWIILFYAKNILIFILSRVLGGIGLGALAGLYTCTAAEYTSLKTRAFSLNLITTVAPSIGSGFAHLLGFILHWRTVALFGAIFSTIGGFLPCLLVESPHWLATKGRYNECKTSFRKLHKSTAESERELEVILAIEKCKFDRARGTEIKPIWIRLKFAFKRKYFWDIMSLSAAMLVYLTAAGKGIFGTLITVILEKITGTSDVLVFTLSVDAAVLFGSLISCVLVKKMLLRNLLFSTGIVANALLIILSACLYFKNDEIYFRWIIVFLLALYFILYNAGPHPVIEALNGEIFPPDIKLFCLFISMTLVIVLFALSIIMLPHLVSLIGYHGLFLSMSFLMTVSLVIVWIKLPETSGKTLHEIEVYFKTNDFDVNKVLNNEQINNFM